jgi:hypothetical protein
VIRPTYLRVKNWTKFQHYRDRRPVWIKFHWRDLKNDDGFGELTEFEQWQLVRIWGMAANSTRLTADEDGKHVPVIPFDEIGIRRGIATAKRVPLEKFINTGWLILVAEEDLLAPVLADDASEDASALLGSEVQRFIKPKSSTAFVSGAVDKSLRSVV